MCVCVCERERARESERESVRERERDREREKIEWNGSTELIESQRERGAMSKLNWKEDGKSKKDSITHSARSLVSLAWKF